MSTQNISIEITQEKLLDILMHSATREDIYELRKDVRKDIAEFKIEVHGEVTGLRGEVRDNFKWTIGILMVTILVPIALHFVK